MSNTVNVLGQEIDKRHVESTILFAMNNIPRADETTLEKFLELVNATGNFGSISGRQLIRKMDLLKKYVPQTCEYSLLALAELLGIHLPIN